MPSSHFLTAHPSAWPPVQNLQRSTSPRQGLNVMPWRFPFWVVFYRGWGGAWGRLIKLSSWALIGFTFQICLLYCATLYPHLGDMQLYIKWTRPELMILKLCCVFLFVYLFVCFCYCGNTTCWRWKVTSTKGDLRKGLSTPTPWWAAYDITFKCITNSECCQQEMSSCLAPWFSLDLPWFLWSLWLVSLGL